MTTIETKPYEILIRIDKTGQKFAHKQDIAIVSNDDGIVAENVLPAEAVSIGDLKAQISQW